MKEFELFIDAEHMRRIFQQRLPEFSQGDLFIAGCQILRTRYKTYKKTSSRGKSFLTACYRLEVENKRTQQLGTQFLYMKAYLQGQSRSEFAKLKPARLIKPEFGEALVHLEDLDVIIWAFPNDPSLPHLPEVVDPELVKKYLPFENLSIKSADRCEIRVEIVHYYPEQRCTCHYELQSREVDALRLFGKTFKDDSGCELYRRMSYFWEKSRDKLDGLFVAPPLGYNETSKTVWQEAVVGKPLVEVMNVANYESLLDAVAKGLTALHKSRLPNLPQNDFSELLPELRKKAAKLARAFPSLQNQLQRIVAGLEKSVPDWTRSARQIIHGDFQAKQLLVSDGKVFFFDFDELAFGDPLQDVASFIVDLHLHDFAPSLVQRMLTTFIRSYRERAEWETARNRLNWHIQFQLVTKVYRMLTYWQHQPDLENKIYRLINFERTFEK